MISAARVRYAAFVAVVFVPAFLLAVLAALGELAADLAQRIGAPGFHLRCVALQIPHYCERGSSPYCSPLPGVFGGPVRP